MKPNLKILALAASLAASLWSAAARSQEPSPAVLTVRILDLAPAGGELVVALFDSPETFAERSPALRSAVLRADAEAGEWRVSGLAVGEYAAVVYQDLDGDRELDRGRLGIPKEPYGFSNDPKAVLGPPSFDQARFSYAGGGETIEIRLNQRRPRRAAPPPGGGATP